MTALDKTLTRGAGRSLLSFTSSCDLPPSSPAFPCPLPSHATNSSLQESCSPLLIWRHHIAATSLPQFGSSQDGFAEGALVGSAVSRSRAFSASLMGVDKRFLLIAVMFGTKRMFPHGVVSHALVVLEMSLLRSIKSDHIVLFLFLCLSQSQSITGKATKCLLLILRCRWIAQISTTKSSSSISPSAIRQRF